MSGLKPLLKSRLSAFERRLLVGGIHEQPDVALQLRMARAVGVNPLVVYLTAVTARMRAFAFRAACGLTALGSALVTGSD